MSGQTDPIVLAIITLVFVITLVLIVAEKMDKAILALLGAGIAIVVLLLATNYSLLGNDFSYEKVHNFIGHELEILGLIVGMTIIIDVAAESGLFQHIAIRILKQTRGEPTKLLVYLGLLTLAFTAVLSNIMAMIIVGTLTVIVCDALDRDLKPYIFAELVFADLGGLLLLISSIPGIIIAPAANIPFIGFSIVSFPYIVPTILVTFLMFRYVLFPEEFKSSPDQEHVNLLLELDEWAVVENQTFFNRSAIILAVVIFAFIIKDSIVEIVPSFNISYDFIAFGGAVAALGLSGIEPKEAFEKIDWSTIFFFIGLFVLIGTVEFSGLLEIVEKPLIEIVDFNIIVGSISILWGSAILSAMIDNIPVAVLMKSIIPAVNPAQVLWNPLWWAAIIGPNVGGNLSPVGSASTVVAVAILKREGVPISFKEFIKYGGSVTFLQLLLGSVYLLILALF